MRKALSHEVAEIWCQKIDRLEQDKEGLLHLFQAHLDYAKRCHSDVGLVGTSAWKLITTRMENRLSEIGKLQLAYERQLGQGRADLGRKHYRDWSRGTHCWRYQPVRIPFVAAHLVAEIEEVAERHQVSARSWLESHLQETFQQGLPDTGAPHAEINQLRDRLKQGPASTAVLHQELSFIGVGALRALLGRLRNQGRVLYGKDRRWYSLEES